MAEHSTASASQERAVLPRDVAVFLPLFGIALHKCTTYPPKHPLLVSAIDAVVSHLRVVLVNRPFLLLGIARNQLLVEGLATDPDNPVLRDLAGKLHRHQLGALKITPGVTAEEFGDVLQVLSADARTNPVGQSLLDYDTRWEHVRLLPPAYERLELAEEQRLGEQARGESLAGRLWIGLAAVALAKEGAPELHSDPRAVARALNQRMRDPDEAKRVIDYLLGLSRELRLSAGAEAAVLKERLGQLLNYLTPETLRDLATLGADLAQRRRLVMDAAMVLPAGAVLTLLRAVSDSSAQAIPQAMVRLLSKLAFQADKGAQSVREEADLAMREAVRQLVDKWSLEDPNPMPYTRVLERLSRHPSGPPTSNDEHPAEALRLVQISLETDTVGDTVWGALDELVREGHATDVLRMVEDPGVAEDIQEHFWAHLATPANMRILLDNEPRDTPVVELLLDRMGMAAAEPMLESLEVADNRAMRRRLLTRLGRLGPAIGPMLIERLPNSPWFVQRNLLALLGSLQEIPADFSPASYAENDDARVRREAIKLMLRIPGQRDDAILAALGDDDDGNVRIGLSAALEGCPTAAVPRLMVLLNDRRLSHEIRSLAIRTLGSIRSPATRDWLVGQALTKPGWFRRRRLVSRSPELLAVLGALARSFRNEPNAQLVLRLATESSDPAIRKAATGQAEEQ
ncbi:MAG TPA: HEAT repeat domain-containing protein [Gemmatimonadales bacterium]|nr:HEAT repeat domain-containing protein [Gemmatimonadales bacterium]